jgi:hypothetical protein
LYGDIDQKLSAIVGFDTKIFQNIVAEYLFYSHLGRADLLQVSKWQEGYSMRNGMNKPPNENSAIDQDNVNIP